MSEFSSKKYCGDQALQTGVERFWEEIEDEEVMSSSAYCAVKHVHLWLHLTNMCSAGAGH